MFWNNVSCWFQIEEFCNEHFRSASGKKRRGNILLIISALFHPKCLWLMWSSVIAKYEYKMLFVSVCVCVCLITYFSCWWEIKSSPVNTYKCYKCTLRKYQKSNFLYKLTVWTYERFQAEHEEKSHYFISLQRFFFFFNLLYSWSVSSFYTLNV